MRKILFSLLFLLTAIFTTQIIANDNFYLINTSEQSKDLHLEISELKSGTLKKAVDDRLGSRDIKTVLKLTVTSGTVNNSDFKFINEELTNLKTLDLSNVEFVEKELLVTFNDKSKLEVFNFPKSKTGYKIANKFFKDNQKLKQVELNGVVELGDFVFENTKQLRNIDLSQVNILGQGAFVNSDIENITFQKQFDLPKEFFKDTTSLTTIDISGAKTIGEAVFYNSSVEFVKMPNSYALEAYTFAKTKNLSTIDLAGATRLGKGDFMESNIESVTFASQFSLPDFYFAKTLKLKEIDLSNAKEIGTGVFAFSSIEKVKFPNEFKLSEGLFQYAEKLKQINVSNANEFEEAVFAGSGLTKITMPEKFEVTNAMFGFMESLLSIDLSGAEFIGSNVFVKKGNNYDYYRKFFDGSNLVSNITNGIETIILGGSVPSVSSDSFANLNDNPPIVLLPKTKEWDGLSNNLISKNNEIETLLRYDSYTYKDLMISKHTLIQIGFLNPSVITSEDKTVNVKYQWYFNDKEIVNGNQSTFTVDKFTANDEGSYNLKVSVDGKVHQLFKIHLKANELAIDQDTLYQGFFLNEEIDTSTVSVIYVKDEVRQDLTMDDLEYDYDFTEVGNTSIKITYTKDDLVVVADYPVKVANVLPQKIKLKKNKSFTYDPMIDGFEFIQTSNQKDLFIVEEVEDSNELVITALEKYKGELDYKFNGRVGQVAIEIVSNFFWLWIGLVISFIGALSLVIYLRQTKGMFKTKK